MIQRLFSSRWRFRQLLAALALVILVMPTITELTNIDTISGTVHVQIFDVSNNCNENNFFDEILTSDAVSLGFYVTLSFSRCYNDTLLMSL